MQYLDHPQVLQEIDLYTDDAVVESSTKVFDARVDWLSAASTSYQLVHFPS
jgi:hypothetical protein